MITQCEGSGQVVGQSLKTTEVRKPLIIAKPFEADFRRWPDFDKTWLVQAIEEYSSRTRRFGGVMDAKDIAL